MLRSPLALLALGALVTACARPSSSVPGAKPTPADVNSASGANPLFQRSPLPFQAPPFDRIRNEHYKPALEEGMRRQLREVEAIAGQSSEPTFENTIAAMERSGTALTRAATVFFSLVGANTNDTLQQVQTEEAPKLAAHSDAIYLNERLFRRVKSLHNRRDALKLAGEEKRLVERYYRDFVRAGAQLPESDKVRLRALNQEEAQLTTAFQNKLLAATKVGAVVVESRSELDGLSDGEVAAAAEAARERGLPGKYVIPLQNTTQHPAQASLRNRAVRRRLFEASAGRAERGDTNDTRATIRRLAQLRIERARLLGFPTYAAFALDDQVAKTPEAALGLLTQLVAPATGRARAEAAKMQALIDREGGGFTLAPWDWQYYAEQVRRQEYDLDEEQLKPYFELDRVLREGVFFAANQLYGLTFKDRKDLPTYHPDVMVFEVFDADGAALALFYMDPYKRDNKQGGAWMNTLVGPSRLLGIKPVVTNVTNYTKPAPGQATLLTFDDVSTLFHEFGHSLHVILSQARYPTLFGTNVPRDFVEFPSQFNEHWALEPRVLARYARHYKTGQPMPQELVNRIKKAETFNQGFITTEYLAAALLDLDWHSLPAGTPEQDVAAFESQSLTRHRINLSEVPPRYRTPYFAHIWGGGYSAGYYAYLWSDVLNHDAYRWFTEHGGMTRANGIRFRDMILSRGNTEDPGVLFRAFRGRDPSIDPLLEARGLRATAGE
ncbi:MAG TPA: M3 family metallopeptidase [Gemmatimonadales bacterium]|nr:M3 family metallopeptidase [Gemmatimonadales bacterium]